MFRPKKSGPVPTRFALLRRFRRSSSGIASVEFGLLSSVIMVMFAGWLDITYMVRARMYSDRSSMLMARAIAACENKIYACTMPTIRQLTAAKENVLVRFPTAELGTALFYRKSGAFKMCAGTMTSLDTQSDMKASTQNIVKDGDVGVATFVRTTYKSFFPSFVTDYLGSAGVTYRDYTIDVSYHDDSPAADCST